MKEKVRALLSKINYIEVDMDLQKQILHAIPSDRKGEMEAVLVKISQMKHQILDLRKQIQETDQDEYNRIVAMEQATQRFKALATEKNFVQVRTPDESGACGITLNDGTRVDCLVAAQDDAGNWTLLNGEGEIKEYPGGLVRE